MGVCMYVRHITMQPTESHCLMILHQTSATKTAVLHFIRADGRQYSSVEVNKKTLKQQKYHA